MPAARQVYPFETAKPLVNPTACGITVSMMLQLPRINQHSLNSLDDACLRALQKLRGHGWIQQGGDDLLERITGQPIDHARITIDRLAERRLILLQKHAGGLHSVVVSSAVRSALRLEAKRNLMRKKRGRSRLFPIAREVKTHFPGYCVQCCDQSTDDTPRKPARAYDPSYMVPATFKPLLEKFPHCHFKQRPPTAEIIAGPYMPDEFGMASRIIAEKLAIGFKLHLLYTRKSISVCRLH